MQIICSTDYQWIDFTQPFCFLSAFGCNHEVNVEAAFSGLCFSNVQCFAQLSFPQRTVPLFYIHCMTSYTHHSVHKSVLCVTMWCSAKLCGCTSGNVRTEVWHQLMETVLSAAYSLCPGEKQQWQHWQSDLDSTTKSHTLCCSQSKSWLKWFLFPLDVFQFDCPFTAVSCMRVTPLHQSVLKWGFWHFSSCLMFYRLTFHFLSGKWMNA